MWRRGELLLVGLVDAALDPPDVAERVAHAADPVAPEEVRDLGDQRAARVDRPADHLVRVVDVQPEERGRLRPVVAAVEGHHHGVADPELRVVRHEFGDVTHHAGTR